MAVKPKPKPKTGTDKPKPKTGAPKPKTKDKMPQSLQGPPPPTPKEPESEGTVELALEELQALAFELNAADLFEEELPAEEENAEELYDQIMNNVVVDGEVQLYTTDELNSESLATLTKMGIVLRDPAEIEDSDDVEQIEPPEEEPVVKPKAKPQAKPKTQEDLPPKVKEESPPKPKAPKKARYTRNNAFVDALKSGNAQTEEELAELSNALYSQSGGTDNVKEAAALNNVGLTMLYALGYADIVNGKVVLN